MLGPVAADNGPFWAGSKLESVAAQSRRPHVVKGIKPCTPKVTKHNSKSKTIVLTILSPPIMEPFEEAHAAEDN